MLLPVPTTISSTFQARNVNDHLPRQNLGRPLWQQSRHAYLHLSSVLPPAHRARRSKTLPYAAGGWRNAAYSIFEKAGDAGRRAVGNLDRRLRIKETAKRATESTQTAVSNGSSWIEKQLDLKKRSRQLLKTIQRDLPKWQRQYRSFNASLLGRAFWIGVLGWCLYTGFIWTIVRFVFVLTWLLPLVIAILARRFSKQVAAAQAQAQQREGGQMGQGPYSQPLYNAFRQSAFQQSAQNAQRQPGVGRTRSSRPNKPDSDFTQSGGPIIDVESVTIDEQDYR